MDYLPFKEIYTQIEQYVQDTGSYRQTRIQDSINREYENVANRYDWPQLKRYIQSGLSQVSGSAFLVMPKDFKFLIALGQSTTGIQSDISGWRRLISGTVGKLTTTGPFEEVAEVGEYAQLTQIVAAEKLRFVSSSASDTTQSIRVRGLVSANEREETVALNGLTTVDSALTYDAGLSVLSIAGSTRDRQGVITVTGVTSGTTYLQIAPYEFTARHRAFRVYPQPTTAINVVVAYSKRIAWMLNDGDVPEIPVSQYLIKRVTGDIWTHMRKRSLGLEMIKEAEQILDTLTEQYESGEPRILQAAPPGGSLVNQMRGQNIRVRYTATAP